MFEAPPFTGGTITNPFCILADDTEAFKVATAANDTVFVVDTISKQVLVNDANVFTVLQATREIYVDPAGDDSNPGTSAAPFATIQKAANVAGYQASSDETIINIAAGTYEEQVVVPKYALGKIRFRGEDLTDPTLTVIEGLLDNPAISTGIDHRNNAAFVVVEGLRIANSFYNIRTERTKLEVTGIDSYLGSYLVLDGGDSDIDFTDNGSYNTTYEGWSGTNFPIVLGRGTNCTIDDEIVATSFDRFVTISAGAQCLTTAECNLTHKAGASFGPFTFFVSNGGRINLQADVIADGNDATPDTDTSFIYFNGGFPDSSFITGSTTFTVSDFDYVFGTADQGTAYYSDDTSITFNKTNVNNDVKANIGAYAFDDTALVAGTSVNWQDNQFNSTVELLKHVAYFNS
jgi:hypothetical protein